MADDVKLILVRSNVTPQKNYRLYVEPLRFDFWYSCAYCSITEVEAGGIRFTIDHYYPKTSSIGKRLICDYNNLMYTCDPCNEFKGNLDPPEKAKAAGYRYFGPDQDDPRDHFKLSGYRIDPISNIGSFTTEQLRLNSAMLQRIRRIREKFSESAEQIMVGIRALQQMSVDELPQQVRGGFLKWREAMTNRSDRLAEDQERYLRDRNRSHVLEAEDPEEAKKQTENRRKQLEHLKALFPDPWRPPRRKGHRTATALRPRKKKIRPSK